MRVTRCRDQGEETLEEFYAPGRWADEASGRDMGIAMMALIERLRALPDRRQVFGLTSLARLCLLAEDSYRTPWFVIIAAPDRQTCYVEYLMPARDAPWPKAYVRGEAHSEDGAVRMILTAMERSEGWANRP